jgi:hypothetical protein
MYDFIMLQYGVPMTRNPDTDMVIIKNIPPMEGYKAAQIIQDDIKW